MRRLFSAIAFICALAGQAFGAGSIPVALSQQFNANGVPLVNCQLFIFVVGTVATPQNAFQDTALTQTLPFPVTCDGNGRLPMFYLADGSVHVRLTDSAGVVQFDYPSMLVIGPSGGGGGGGGGTVDPTTILSTGDIKFRATGETLTGWIKLNGQTIGSATSGASGRANADTQSLFTYIWQNCPDAHCPVGSGRGANAAADFAANKQITLLDWRGRLPVGLDDMGASAAGRLLASNVTSGGGDGVTTANATGGESNHTLLTGEIPSHQHSVFLKDPGHTHGEQAVNVGSPGGTFEVGGQNLSTSVSGTSTSTLSATTGLTIGSVNGVANDNQTATVGGGAAHNVMSPFMLGTWFIKL